MTTLRRILKLAALAIICAGFGPVILLAWIAAFLTEEESAGRDAEALRNCCGCRRPHGRQANVRLTGDSLSSLTC
jgi:hypothetical protein